MKTPFRSTRPTSHPGAKKAAGCVAFVFVLAHLAIPGISRAESSVDTVVETVALHSRELTDPRERGDAVSALAATLALRGEKGTARALFDEAAKTAGSNLDASSMAVAYMAISDRAEAAGMHDVAVTLLAAGSEAVAASAAALSHGPTYSEIGFLLDMATRQNARGDARGFDDTLRRCDHLIEIIRESWARSLSLMRLGTALAKNERKDAAFEAFTRAREVASTLPERGDGETYPLGSALISIAQEQHSAGFVEAARETYLMARGHFPANDESRHQALVLMGILVLTPPEAEEKFLPDFRPSNIRAKNSAEGKK